MRSTRLNESEQLLKELVDIDSQVGNTNGIRIAQQFISTELESLGFQVKLIENSQTLSAPLLHGKLAVSPALPRITFIGHSDVITSPSDNPFRLYDEQDRIAGSGVADDKGGIVACISAVKDFLGSIEELSFNIDILISPSEETGSLGFHEYFSSIADISNIVLGLEPALNDGSVIGERSGNRWYHIRAKGISAHSGRFGEDYINASHYLARVISSLHELNDENKRIRVNVGSFGGGEGHYNKICDSAWANIDTRFPNIESRERLDSQIEAILENSKINCPYSGREIDLSVEIIDDCPPMSSSDLDETQLLDDLVRIISLHEGEIIHSKKTGGAADINYFQNGRCLLLDGLGPRGHGMHTNSESICRKSLQNKISALTAYLEYYNATLKTRSNPCNYIQPITELIFQSS